MRILVVEDEKKIARFIGKALQEQGFAVDLCHHGDEALGMLQDCLYDAAVLDIMLPGRDGLSLLRQLRDSRNAVPVLLLTARGGVSERIEGLNLGADDYLPKPFAVDELIARLRSVLRRFTGQKLNSYKVGDLSLNLLTREVARGSRRVELTAREFSVLEFLMRTPGHVLTRTQICERVWDYHFDPGTNLVDVYIQRVRRKIDADDPIKLIQTVRGIGYSIKAPA